jgi:excinuclease ABC subunit A
VLVDGKDLGAISALPVGEALSWFRPCAADSRASGRRSPPRSSRRSRSGCASSPTWGSNYLTLDAQRRDPLRRRGPAHPPGQPDRRRAGGRHVHPRRAVHRPAPARQRAPAGTLTHLRDLGNTVIVVEHDEDAIRAADHVVDIGPGAGVHGGEVVARAPPTTIMANPGSLTGATSPASSASRSPRTRRTGQRNASCRSSAPPATTCATSTRDPRRHL